MGEALAEAQLAASRGERPIAAVAVMGDAMVVRAHDRVEQADDPTAHAVVVALREAARRLGRERLVDVTIFTTIEPCAMCVGALLESDVEALVYALPNTRDGAAGTVVQLSVDFVNGSSGTRRRYPSLTSESSALGYLPLSA